MKFLVGQFTIVIILMYIFLRGYFPYTQHDAPIINPPTEIDGIPVDLHKFYKPQVQKLVLIIIDALRYDFITSTNMPSLHQNMKCLLKVKVEAPTVTLPRLKALTSGVVPQFIDIVLNLGATAKIADSFIHRAHASGKKMIFYGDDTWLKMFPTLFIRGEGTTSFFVNDFTEVDDNVTRHIGPELEREWDMMFLHYLGLDHIGHVKGPFSNLIPRKLHEMDSIIKQIIAASQHWEEDTIVMITGDHGMKDSGGHGGTTYAETHVPLILYHNKGINCQSSLIIQQSDIANTLSALFGIAMPANSAGKVIKHLLSQDKAHMLYALYYNTLILQRNSDHTTICKDNLAEAKHLFKKVIQSGNFTSTSALEAETIYTDCLQELSAEIIDSSVHEDLLLLVFSLFGSISCLGIVFLPLKHNFKNVVSTVLAFLTIIFISTFIYTWYAFVLQFIATILVVMLTIMLVTYALLSGQLTITINTLQLVPMILHGALLMSSSYIEEEQYIFYYFTCTTSVLIAMTKYFETRKITLSTAMPLTVIEIIRICRSVEESKDWFLKDEHFVFLQLFHVLALALIVFIMFHLRSLSVANVVTLVVIHLHKFHFERSVRFAQFVWFMIFVQIVIACNTKRRFTFLCAWILIMAFQLRPYNTILVPSMITCSYIFKSALCKTKNSDFIVIIHVWLGYAFFFMQGHRNSIANIDLAPGYLGLSTYIPVLVSLMTLSHCYACPTLGMILLFTDLNDNRDKQTECLKKMRCKRSFEILFCYKLFILLVIYIVILINRGHLFVWSVFAPKLLIDCMHTFVLYLQIMFYILFKFVMF